MKKTLSLILAVMMLLGCMSITAFAADNEATISAEITAADFGYTMVIPTSTTLTEAKHENVLLGTTAAADGDGIVSIKDIKHPTDKVNVYYTVDLTNGDLTDGTNTIAATYKYKQGANEFAAITATTKVTVYKNATVKDSSVNVTADKDQWNAAPTGTYNASVTFNFAKEIVKPVGELIAMAETPFPTTKETGWTNGSQKCYLSRGQYIIFDDGRELTATFSNSAIEKEPGTWVFNFGSMTTVTFTVEGEFLKSITVNSTNPSVTYLNGTYVPAN